MITNIESDEKFLNAIGGSISASPGSSMPPQSSQTDHDNVLKQKRQPSITPRKFRRFFSPRSHDAPRSSTRRALEDITGPANNQNDTSSSPLRHAGHDNGQEGNPIDFTRDLKRRKLLHTPSPSPQEPGLEKSPSLSQQSLVDSDGPQCSSQSTSTAYSTSKQPQTPEENPGIASTIIPPTRIKQLDSRGMGGSLLGLNIGCRGRANRYRFSYPVADWQDQTEAFYSLSEDTHLCASSEGSVRSIPFCAASCNTNSLVAIGDEEGQIRLLESARSEQHRFKDVFLSFHPHSNAIIDLSFSRDDSLLATASGDQTARIIDMSTQRTISILAKHTASLKQVRFQPGVGSSSVIASSSRDGAVHIWDLRCKSSNGPVVDFQAQQDQSSRSCADSNSNQVPHGCVVKSVHDAHRLTSQGRLVQAAASQDGMARHDAPGRNGDVSITAITFLPEGQEHLLLTACEANASVKLWDIRAVHNSRRKAAPPLSCTAFPEMHQNWRDFGISSLSLSGDASRLYAVCKDSTVYAYSTAHLILGKAPELSNASSWKRRLEARVQESPGPLYGFRHPQLRVATFYVKGAVRPAKAGKAEMLSVGSCDGCAVLFPTDERYHEIGDRYPDSNSSSNSNSTETSRGIASSQGSGSTLPMSERGTALIRGHDREVGGLTWTSEGDLMTIGDDFLVRCWREGRGARKIRIAGEGGGKRWGCGWANVSESYDEEEED